MTSAKRLAFAFGIALVALLGSVSAAQAQYAPPPPYYPPPPPPPPRGVYRSGLVVGFGVGGGAITASNCDPECGGAFAGEFHIGGMIHPRMAILFDAFGAFHPWTDPVFNDSHTTTNSFWMGALQYWATDILWVKGGMGIGHIQVTNNSGNFVEGDETGFGLMGAVGVEVVQSYNFALDIQGRIAHGFYSQGGDANNFALLVGFNWY
jgi:hypothetical protein